MTLLRRLSLDLIGLPPTLAEVDAFLADDSARRLRASRSSGCSASPHYGERWGRHWLDAARYADSDGFEKDKPRYVWFYRDWVIDALNRDLPYDQFVIEQIAGDLLPDATQDQIVATGFLRNSMINEEGGIDPEQFRMEAMFDRMDAIGKSMLGLTIQCAQCHNHKFDPLTQEEYYRLFAFLNNDHEAQRRGLHARGADASAPTCCAQIARDRSRAAARARPTGRADGGVGSERSRTTSRSGPSLAPDASTTPAAARSSCLLKDGSMLCAGLRARRKHTYRSSTARPTLADDHGLSAGTAERSEPAARRARAARSRAPAR